MTLKGERFPVLRLSLFIILIILTVISFGGVPQNQAHFNKLSFAPVIYYFAYFALAGLLFLFLWWFCVMVFRGRIAFRRTPLDIPIALLLIYVIIRIPFSPSRYLVVTEFIKLMVLVGFFYFTVNNIGARKHAKFVIFSMITAAFLISIYGLVNTTLLKHETVLGLHRFAGYQKRISATYICPNHFAGLLEMMIPFAVSYAIMSRLKVTWKCIIGASGLVMITAMVFTQSRGGWAALGAGMITVGLVSIRKVKVPVVALATPAIITAALLVFLLASTPTLKERVTETFQEEDTSYANRKYAWLDTLEMAKHNFILGSAPGTYKYAFTRYQRPGYFVQVNHAHNDYLQTLAEYGIIGLMIVMAMIVIVSRTAGRMMGALKDRDDLACISGIFGAFIAICVHSFVDFNMHIPANAILLTVLVGILFSVRRYSLNQGSEFEVLDLTPLPKNRILLGMPALLLALLLVSIGLFVTARRYLGDYYHHLGFQQDISISQPGTEKEKTTEHTYHDAVQNYLTAYTFNPDNPDHAGALANLFLHQVRSDAGGSKRPRLFSTIDFLETFQSIKEAASYGEKAVEGNPMYGAYHLRLALAYDALARFIKAAESPMFEHIDTKGLKEPEEYVRLSREHHEMAVATYPNSPQYNEKLAEFYLRNGQYKLAGEYATRTIHLLEDTSPWKKRGAATVLFRLAASYYRQKEYSRARQFAFKAADQLQSTIDRGNVELKNVLEALAQHYLEEQEYELARKVAFRTCRLLRGSPGWRKSSIAEVLENLTEYYYNEQDYEVAGEVAFKAVDMLKVGPYRRKSKLRDILSAMAEQYFSQHEYQLARDIALKTIELMDGSPERQTEDVRRILRESEEKLAESENDQGPSQ